MESNQLILDIDGALKIQEPGFCVKTFCKKTGAKFFLNVCHSKSVSPPTLELDEVDLKRLIEKHKYHELSEFSIPLILGAIETTTDKKGQKAKVTDVIVNSKFFAERIQKSKVYQDFLNFVVTDVVNNKFDLKLDNSSSRILKTKKFQLPDGVKQFPKYFSNVMSTKFLDTETKLIANEKQQQSETFADKSKISPQQQQSDDVGGDDAHEKYKNIIISLDLDMEMILIKIKLDLQRIDGLKLCLNDDHVLLSSDGGKNIIHDFYLPMPMKYTMAKACIENNILTIQCPVRL